MVRAVVSFLAVLLLLVNAVSNTNVKSPYSVDQLQKIYGRMTNCTDQVPTGGKRPGPGFECWAEGALPLQEEGLKKEEVTAIVTKCLKKWVPNNPAIHVSVEKCLSKAMALPV